MRRLFWLSSGYVAGLSTSIWLLRRIRRVVERYTPALIRQGVMHSTKLAGSRYMETVDGTSKRMNLGVRRVVSDVREAFAEGKKAMQHTERELRL